MCGIAGIWARDASWRAAPSAEQREAWTRDVAAMLAAIAHRGPDGTRIITGGAGVLGACRLAILDPEHGAQPMTTSDGRHAIAFNGAVVNFVELRASLEADGARFRTCCDTEVLLEGLARRGPAFLGETNGMFAAALFDDRDGSALLFRDPCGIKPLYWLDEGDRVLFASEVKGLLAAARRRPRACSEAVLDYLAFQTPLSDLTFFEGVRRLPAGAMLRLARGAAPRIEPLPAWSAAADVPEDPEQAADALRAILDAAVRDHLRADVAIGAHLSGGVDSSYVCAAAARHLGEGRRLVAFTGAFDEPGFDERTHARAVAAAIGADVVEAVPTAADLLASLPAVVRAMDEPMAGPGLLPQWFVAREAAKRVKVVLGGQGGDELFSGYVRHLIVRLEGALGAALRGGDTRVLRDLAPHLASLDGYEPLLRRHFGSGLFAPVAERYFSLVHRGGGLDAVLAGDLRAAHAAHPARGRFLDAFESGDADPRRDPVHRAVHSAVRFDRRTLLPALLHVEDRTSMAWSVESRVPLLDRRVLAFVDGASDRVLFGDGALKHLFRRAVREDLPRPARERRDKMGFPVPLALWARGPLRAPLRDILLGGVLRSRGLVDESAVPRLLDGETVEARHLWALLNLELWHREFDA